MLILPRQARDKHRESSQKQTVFLQSKHCADFETRLVELARSDDSGREPAAAAAGSGSEVLSDGKSYTRLSAEVVSLDESVGDLTDRVGALEKSASSKSKAANNGATSLSDQKKTGGRSSIEKSVTSAVCETRLVCPLF